jgi:Protein of unknown function (DUF1501)
MKQSLCSTSNPTFAALVTDLDERGLLDQTLVIANAEFGRTPKINANAGRDPLAVGLLDCPGGGRCKARRGVRLFRQGGCLSDRTPARSQGPGRDDLSLAGSPGGYDHLRPDLPATSSCDWAENRRTVGMSQSAHRERRGGNPVGLASGEFLSSPATEPTSPSGRSSASLPRTDPANPAGSWGSLSYKIGILSACPVLLVK